jgi:hypothetical protein
MVWPRGRSGGPSKKALIPLVSLDRMRVEVSIGGLGYRRRRMWPARVAACLGTVVALVLVAPAIAEQEFLFYFGFGPACG